jgi:hypothetical protein
LARAQSAAPEAIEPVAGWRVWDVVELDGSLRLCSLNFWTVWVPGRAAVAICRRSLVDPGRAGLPEHPAPQARCTCGIYATQTARQSLEYSRQFPLRADTVHRVAGRVRLWGSVVECVSGWRGESAYPSALFVPTGERRLRSRRPLEEVALGLSVYGVPIEIADVRRLEPSDPRL